MPTQTLDLDSHYALTDEQVARFRRDGYIKLRHVLSPDVLAHYETEISHMVEKLRQEHRAMEQRDIYSKAFLQISNIWTQNEAVKEFVMSKRLGRIATELIGTTGVRMYHDQALYKEPSGGYTPWHVDQFYWPLSNENTVTAWIPLVPVPMECGPLEFSIGSQKIKFGRDFAISEESEKRIDQHLKVSDFPVDSSPYDLGEVSFHYGFTFHRAGPNTSEKMRKIMTIIYMDKDMKLQKPLNPNQQNDWDNWMPGAQIGQTIDSPLNPVIYQEDH
ncbi:phytanoyl-CoA dioxygenase family protein [Pelagicoccus enzymogenes]|uniref:phytanoyl-CoA dioxygenase family protein n=1 Tax=Pelagicoccus enzymogenes TaxID=2773457 RepID=UPI0028106CB1|nr:phytanoyl-CoA dioxygenase family protein [Pelagicoccus enzymogenes]MDQ8199894.1 phytanoyl-CoA dioxygenase family protein [Pelagicoccus enzymogenes]